MFLSFSLPPSLPRGNRHRQRLHNLMLVISLAHKHGGNFSNFELVARGGDCPCDWTYCFGAVTCMTSHPDYQYLNPAYVQWFDQRDGQWTAADDRVSAYVSYARGLPWKERASVAVFRGTLNHMTTVQGLPGDPFLLLLNATNLHQYGRGKLMTLRQETGNSSQYLDVNMDAGQTFAGLHVDQPRHLDLREQARRFKYAVVIEGSCGWADRLKWVLALGLVPILQVPSARLFHSHPMKMALLTQEVACVQETRCVEWYTPMLQPWVHYLPVDGQLNDLVAVIKWAQQNDDAVWRMSQAGMEFATNVISRVGMVYYTQRLIRGYVERLHEANRPSAPLPHMTLWRRPGHKV